jgi:hypothetical protein
MANEGEAVTETEDITESTRTEVFVQFTVVFLSSASGDLGMGHEPNRYSVDFALDHHGGVLAAIQADNLVDLGIFYRKPWLILLVLLGRRRQV